MHISPFTLAPFECEDCGHWWWDDPEAADVQSCDKCGSTNVEQGTRLED